MKKIILGRSDAWSMSHLSHWPSKPAFYIDDCQISGRGRTLWNSTIYMKCGRNGWWQSWYVMSFFLMLSHSSLAHPSFALKSDNLQYYTLVCYFTWTNDSSTKRLMFQVLFFFHKFIFFYKFIKIKSFECPTSIKNYEKIMLGTSDPWLTSHLSQRTSISYCRLSDFWFA